MHRIFTGAKCSDDERHDETLDTLAAIITLSSTTQQTLADMNEEYRTYYFVQISPLTERPLEIGFVTHWQVSCLLVHEACRLTSSCCNVCLDFVFYCSLSYVSVCVCVCTFVLSCYVVVHCLFVCSNFTTDVLCSLLCSALF
jgi:hypothetical protein